jgi:hypothetical protein
MARIKIRRSSGEHCDGCGQSTWRMAKDKIVTDKKEMPLCSHCFEELKNSLSQKDF